MKRADIANFFSKAEIEAMFRAAREAASATQEKPKKPRAIQIALRIPSDVLARWKAGGPGWQTRMVQRLSAP